MTTHASPVLVVERAPGCPRRSSGAGRGHLAPNTLPDRAPGAHVRRTSLFTIFQDVVDHPTDEAAPYDPATGVGAVGAELLAASISRGNFDEQLGADAMTIIEGTRRGFLRDNPHQVDLELVSHGYGVVEITREGIDAQVFFSPILGPSDEEIAGPSHRVPLGFNRFAR